MERVYNRSFTFILPMLDWWTPDFLVIRTLMGCFIGDKDYPELNNHIFLLYKFDGGLSHLNFEEDLMDSDYFVTRYEPDKYHTMYVYDVPNHHQANYDNIKAGKYSSVTESYKNRLIEFHKTCFNEKAASVIASVVYKHESQYKAWENKMNEGLPLGMWTYIPRDLDPAEIMNMEDEVYSDKYKQKSALLKAKKGGHSAGEKE